MTGTARETAPATRSRWIDLAIRVQTLWRNAGARRWMRLLGLAVLMGGAAWSVTHLDLDLSRLSLELIVLNVVVLAPLNLVLAALSLRISARALGHDITLSEGMNLSAVANVADLLPLPAGAAVRYSALVKAGAGLGESGGMITLTSVLMLTMTITLSAIALAYMGHAAGIWMALASAAGVIATLVWLGRRVRADLLASMVLVRIAIFAHTLVSIIVAFATLGESVTVLQAALYTVAPTLGSAVAIVPAGFGVNEAIAAGLATLVSSSPSAAFLAIALNRALSLASGAIVVGIFSLLGTRAR